MNPMHPEGVRLHQEMLRRDAEEHRLAAALRRGRRATTRHRTRTRRLAALVLRRPNRPNRLAGGLA